MSDLVSIVIPTYNRERYIKESIESALHQTYNNIEVIVVDDGSTDNTPDICRQYGATIKYFSKSNGGCGSATNYGITHMSGDWFQFLGSDDMLMPNAVETLLREGHKTKRKVVYSDWMLVDEGGNHIRDVIGVHRANYYEYASHLWEATGNENLSAMLIHKSCFKTVGLFSETMPYSNDYDWWLRACILHKYHFHHVPMILAKYRIHKGQITETSQYGYLKNRYRIRNRVRKEILSSDPEWWATLTYHRKHYIRANSPRQIVRGLRRDLLVRLPDEEAIKILRQWARIQPYLKRLHS